MTVADYLQPARGRRVEVRGTAPVSRVGQTEPDFFRLQCQGRVTALQAAEHVLCGDAHVGLALLLEQRLFCCNIFYVRTSRLLLSNCCRVFYCVTSRLWLCSRCHSLDGRILRLSVYNCCHTFNSVTLRLQLYNCCHIFNSVTLRLWLCTCCHMYQCDLETIVIIMSNSVTLKRLLCNCCHTV